MEILVDRCCGLDVHRSSIVAHVVSGRGRRQRGETAGFGTTAEELERLRDWLLDRRVQLVAMESTGVYWRPVHRALLDRLPVQVCNARHVRNLPGRKTDVADAEWLAHLARHGLLRPSFVPEPWQVELRELLRSRRSLVDEASRGRNRILKLLESADIKLAGVLSDVFGVSGSRILRALADGESEPERLADLAHRRLENKRPQLIAALAGRLDTARRFLLGLLLDQQRGLDELLARLDAEIDSRLQPWRPQLRRLIGIPGVDRIAAASLLAEVGSDVERFPTAGHLTAWAGLAPGNRQTAGRRHHAPTRDGNVHLKTALCTAAVAASRTRGTYYRDKYHRLKARRGAPRARVAIARHILVAVWHILKHQTDYRELGDAFLDQRNRNRILLTTRRRLKRLGFDIVPIQPQGPDSQTGQGATRC